MTSSTQRKPQTKQQLKRSFNTVMLIAISFVAISIGSLLYLTKTSADIPLEILELQDMTLEVKSELTLYHLWLEEIIMGDPALQAKDIAVHMERANSLVLAMLKENRLQTHNHSGAETESKVIADAIQKLQTHILLLKSLGDARMSLTAGAGVGTGGEIEFDRVFAEALNQLDRLKSGLSASLEKDIAAHELSIYQLATGFAIVSLLFFTIFTRSYWQQYLANQRLIANEAQTKVLLGASVGILVTTNEQGLIETFNKAAEDIFGYTEAEVKGQPFKTLISEPYASKTSNDLQNYLRSGDTKMFGVHRETLAKRKDNSTFPMEAMINAVQVNGQTMFVATGHDIAERRQSEQKNRDQEVRAKAIVDTAVDGIVTIDEQDLVETYNHAAEKIFGYTAEEVIGKKVTLLMPRSTTMEHPSLLAAYRHAEEANTVGASRRGTGQNKEGRVFPVELSVAAVELGDRHVMTCIVRDITERIKTEQVIFDRDALTKAIIDTAVDGVIIIDELGLVETYNRSAEKIFGYRANEVVGNNIKMLMPQPYAAEHDGYLANYQRTGKATIIGLSREVIGQRKDGSTFPMDLSVAEVKLGTRSIFTGIVRDVSERNAAQAELSEVKNTLDQTLDCVYMFEAESLLFFYANHNASAEIGYSNDELMTMRPFDIKPEFDEARFRNTIQPLLDGSISSLVFETIHRHKDGNDIPVEISLQYLDTGRQDGHFVAIVRNIAQRKLAESQLILAKEDAEKANHAKSDFLSRMSHELRTPLNAILGFGQLLEMDELNPIQNESVKHIIKAGRHLTGLINEVLDIARIESGHQNLSLEPLKLRTLLNETRQLMVPLAAERNIQLQELAHGQCEAHVVADLQRLKQVLLNLISNALKYNHDGGQVTLFCEEKREGILRINIRDTGPGIAPDNLHRIFEPFERLDADARGVEGSGVGLALSKALIEAMGGVLGVDSQVGAGSTFWIELAIIDPPSASDAAQHMQQKTLAQPDLDNSQTATVLYIEDNVANFRLVEVALSRRPHIQLITAMEGQLGIELALRHQPDVILLDIHLPVLMGDKVLARLRSQPETQHIPIVVVSADATQSKIDKLLAAGAHSYLTKPFNIKELLRTVDSLLEARSN